MEKTIPAPLPEQLALPLEESAPPSAEAKDVHPHGVWETLEPKNRVSVEKRWVRVMREAVCDARD
jgi:hypothetical protein